MEEGKEAEEGGPSQTTEGNARRCKEHAGKEAREGAEEAKGGRVGNLWVSLGGVGVTVVSGGWPSG